MDIVSFKNSALSILDTYWNGSAFQALFYIACIIIFVYEKDKLKKYCFVYYSLIIVLVIINPVTSYMTSHILGWTSGDGYFKRIFFACPFMIVIAYGFTKLISISNKKYAKLIIVLLCCFSIWLCNRTTVYSALSAYKVENYGHIPTEVYRIAEMIESKPNEHTRVICPDSICVYLKQVKGDIYLLTTRNGIGQELSNSVSSTTPDYTYINSYVKSNNVTYVVFGNITNLQDYKKHHYKIVGNTANYVILEAPNNE